MISLVPRSHGPRESSGSRGHPKGAAGSQGRRGKESEEDQPTPSGRSESFGNVIGHYQGHRNVQTVKGCNFFGTHDEYVVSGSDCGHVFIWGKEDGKLLQLVSCGKCGGVDLQLLMPSFHISPMAVLSRAT